MTTIKLGTVFLPVVVDYSQEARSTIPFRKIRGKSTPTVDTDAFVTEPQMWNIRAYVSTVSKNTLKGYRGSSQTLVDDDGSDTVWVEEVKATKRTASADYPWEVNITLMEA